MTGLLPKLRSHVRAWLRCEDGNSTIGFVIVFPIFLVLFMAAFEIGMFAVRQTVLDRAVDVTVRAIRLGQMVNPDHDTIKDTICNNAPSLPNCDETLKVNLVRVATTTWTLPNDATSCHDRALPLNPVGEVDPNPQARQVLMLMRVCYIADAIFPGGEIATRLQQDGAGGYQMFASTAFLNEP